METAMRMESGDIAIRNYRNDDREQLAGIADNPNVARHLANRFPHPYTLADADAWLALTGLETRPCNFAIEWRGELAGGIGLDPLSDIHSGTAELGYWLGEPYWGKGLASRAVGLLLPYAFGELFFIRLQAKIFAENRASMRVLEKNGFVREGVMRKHISKNGIVSDAVLYAKLRNP